MIAFILTALAGIAIGVIIMRLVGGSAPVTQNPLSEDARSIDQLPTPVGDVVAETPPTVAAQPSGGLLARFDRTQLMFGSAAAIIAIAAALIAFRSNDTVSNPGTAPSTVTAPVGAQAGALDDVNTMISKLAERLKTDTTDGEGFRMLGWSYVNTGRPADAVTAYINAVKLLPGRADVHAGYGEALVAVAKDVVTPEAKVQFDEAIKLDRTEPRARFFLALHKAQNGQEHEALEEWIALSNSASAELPWQADLQQRANKLASKLGVNISGKFKQAASVPAVSKAAGPFMSTGPDAAELAAAEKLPAAQQQSMIDGMVEGLAAKMKSNPDDVDGWVKLIRSRVVLKDSTKAKDDLGMARKAFAKKPEKLAQINALAAELGL
jgi:cytochrome c-type biogenesis protein CcmH